MVVEIYERNEQQLVEIWLSRREKEDAYVQMRLKALYGEYRRRKYRVVLYQSGEKNLYNSTLDLLIYNKKHSAAGSEGQQEMLG